ncbi:MAG TPA: hypothetical protein HA272_03415 [Methanoregula sp.]|nr:hypothetical protein [Methanoregula sp.]
MRFERAKKYVKPKTSPHNHENFPDSARFSFTCSNASIFHSEDGPPVSIPYACGSSATCPFFNQLSVIAGIGNKTKTYPLPVSYPPGMANKYLLISGIVSIILGIIASSYTVNQEHLFGLVSTSTAPYAEFAIPLIIAGIVLIIVGFVLENK